MLLTAASGRAESAPYDHHLGACCCSFELVQPGREVGQRLRADEVVGELAFAPGLEDPDTGEISGQVIAKDSSAARE